MIIVIQDNGIGIPKEYLSKVFDPYFTTRQKGSGLGLTTSYSIIKNHGVYITVESKVSVGTTVRIYIPASKKPVTMKKEEEAFTMDKQLLRAVDLIKGIKVYRGRQG